MRIPTAGDFRAQTQVTASSAVYDERDLLLQSTRGSKTPPVLALLAPGDPTDYDVRGGEESTTTYHYDQNRNLVEMVDPADTHGSPLLGMGWTALGAAIDPVSFRKLMDHNRWSLSLAQCSDGTFYYQPNRDNNPQDYAAAPRLAATATTALILSIKDKKLQMTGAELITR